MLNEADSSSTFSNSLASYSNLIPTTKPISYSITVYTKKKSSFKSNIHITQDMTFQNLLDYIFPKGPSTGKRFIIKSSLDHDSKNFLSEQVISKLFIDRHVDIWIDIEDVDIKFDDLFD
ncbi:6759_t:CDS:2 [Cetraspora pellucida]|uniref:6759_t:CDS:1 n=1 Tax=Cetraspora pellucida TaxID=1433469 RepID=A0ACA9L0B2_9GLOM|nr:6759_t:CDS:2 [Cetraspora pellucida]